MKTHRFALLLCALASLLAISASAVDGTFTVTEEWSATLEYDGFGNGVTTTKSFNGRQSGTLVIQNGEYQLINRTGLALQGTGSLTPRSVFAASGFAFVDGHYPFAPGFAARAYGILFLGAFIVKVPLVDGEVPAFYDFEYFSATGSSLASMSGYGEMTGVSLRVTVRSTLSMTPKTATATMPPRIVTEPKDKTVAYGRKAVLSVRARGPSLSYQWWRNGTPIEGATGATLTLPQATSDDSGAYVVTISNSFGDTTSRATTLTVLPPVPPALKIQPRDRTARAGGRLKLTGRAKGSLPLVYQWHFNNEPISGGTNASLQISPVQMDHSGAYFLVAGNAAGSVTSRVATVVVREPR